MSASASLAKKALAGDIRSIAKLMSAVEGDPDRVADQMAAVHARAGRAHIVGLTGVPGSGKSTMVQALTKEFRKSGKTVGIVAIDPSSPYSGGAILGDRVRMTELSTDPGVFIRSLATRGALGGLARAAMDTAEILDAAGYDLVLIETVGVGQDEVDIAEAAHSVLVVSAPGLGDDVQAIKAGVLEIADIHVVSKCDKAESSRTVADLKAMMKLGNTARDRHGWDVPVIRTSAQTGLGLETLADAILRHGAHLDASGEGDIRRRRMIEQRILKTAEDILRRRLTKGDALNAAVERTLSGRATPRSAASDLLTEL